MMCFSLVYYHNVWLIGLDLEALQDLDLGGSNHITVQVFLYTTSAIWLFYSVYAVSTCILHFVIVCQIDSKASLHSLCLGS